MNTHHATYPDYGVYIHIPFCSRRCDYCAFATWDDRHELQSAYMRALGQEIARAVDEGMPPANTVFVGGGTPSMVNPEELAEALRLVPLAPGDDHPEVTVECNPDNVTESLMRTYADAGVNRISLGVQSMVPHVLKGLGREHDPDNVVSAVAALRAAGIPTHNMDLIYGAHGESLADWETTLQRALELDPPHISAYGLTVEPGTPLADDALRHPDDDDQADKYPVANRMLDEAGLFNYEISNWSRPGHESRHNRLYWAQYDYRGFGCAAHSHASGRRWWNVRTPERYIDLVGRGESVEAASETLTAEQIVAERVQLAVRRREGVVLADIPGDPSATIAELANDGLVEVRGDRLVLTESGRLLANAVTLRLI